MRVTILGSGTGLPSARRASPGIWVRAGSRNLLFDSGPGALTQLARAGLSIHELDFLCYTHFHPDHTLDLLAFLFASRNPMQPPRTRPFTILAPSGFSVWYRKAVDLYGNWVEPPEGSMNVVELAPEPGRYPLTERLLIEARPVEHTPHSLGFRLEERPGGIMAYGGDSDVCPELVELGRNADIFVLECSMPNECKIAGHLTPEQAAVTAARSAARRLVLTHLYPPCDEVDLKAQCGNGFPGEIIVGEDLMSFEVP